MIIIQIVLIVAIVLVMIRLLTHRQKRQVQAWKKVGLVSFALAAIGFVLFPEVTNRIANFVGVGRGADLLLYVLTMAFIFMHLNAYIKAKDENRRFVKVVRRLAIIEARLNASKDS